MSSYLKWNDALAGHFFFAGQKRTSVVLYMDRKLVDEIGAAADLGGWEDFLKAAEDRPDMMPGLVSKEHCHPLSLGKELLSRWREYFGWIDGHLIRSLEQPPYFLALCLLILGWTERPNLSESSYYKSLEAFLKKYFPHAPLLSPSALQNLVHELVEGIDEFIVWLSGARGGEWGEICDGTMWSLKYVGRIRFHAFMDPGARALLPLFWRDAGLKAGSHYQPQTLYDCIAAHPLLEERLPQLARFFQYQRHEIEELLPSFLAAEFPRWDGSIPADHRYDALAVNPRLRLRMCMTSDKGVHCQLQGGEMVGELEFNWSNHSFQAQFKGETHSLPIPWPIDLQLPRTGNADGLKTLCGRSIRVDIDDYMPFAHAFELGFPGSNFMQVSRLRRSGAFKVMARGQALEEVLLWAKANGNCKGWQKQGEWRGWMIFVGRDASNDPFCDTEVEEDGLPAFELAGGKGLGSGRWYQELLPVIRLNLEGEGLRWEAVAARPDQQAPMRISPRQDDPATLEIDTVPRPHGRYHLRLFNGEALLDSKTLDLMPAPVLAPMDWARIPRCFPAESLPFQRGQSQVTTLGFAHQHFIGEAPRCPKVVARFAVPQEETEQLAAPSQSLGAMLVAAAQPQSDISFTRFEELLNLDNRRAGHRPLWKSKVLEIRKDMETLGFFHQHWESDRIHLSPLQLILLPDDYYRIRAIITGPMNYAVQDFLQAYVAQAGHGIAFRWIYQDDPRIPPVLQLSTNVLARLRQLRDAVNLRFPGALTMPHSAPLSQMLLDWLTPYPSIKQYRDQALVRRRFQPGVEELFDLAAAQFVDPVKIPHFPAITKTENQHTRAWITTWWDNPHVGFEVDWRHALPALFSAHSIPYLFQNAARTDEIAICGQLRLTPLLERALAMATGSLPRHSKVAAIPALKAWFDEGTSVRIYQGLRPPLRQRLATLLSNTWTSASHTVIHTIPFA